MQAIEIFRRLRSAACPGRRPGAYDSRLEFPAHRLVLDPGFLEAFTVGSKAELLVEAKRPDLGVERHFAKPQFPGLLDQGQQQRLAHALAAPFLEHRHSPDLVLGGQATGADRPVLRITCDHVMAFRIERIPLFFQRDLLFDHEDGLADAAQILEIDRVVGRLDAKFGLRNGVHRRGFEGRLS